jgi:hypothetical protein
VLDGAGGQSPPDWIEDGHGQVWKLLSITALNPTLVTIFVHGGCNQVYSTERGKCIPSGQPILSALYLRPVAEQNERSPVFQKKRMPLMKWAHSPIYVEVHDMLAPM